MPRVQTPRTRRSRWRRGLRLLLLDCLCVLAVSGCALPVALLDKSRPQSPKLIVLPLQTEAAAMTRDEVRAKLGEPMLVGSNDEYYIYKVVVEDRRPVLYWVFPYTPLPLPEKLTHTQIVGVWFGADGRVEKIVEDMILNAQGAWWPPCDREVARLDRWMQEHRPPPRQPGSERAPATHGVGGADDEALMSHAPPAAHVERSATPGVQAEATAVVVFDVPFGISVNRFQAANPLFGCREASDRFRVIGDQFCWLGLEMTAACRSGETTEACRRSLRMALNFLGVLSEEALASNSRPRALAQSRNAYFVDNRLGAVTWHFDGDACDDVLRAVEARYGPAGETAIEGDPPPGWGGQKMTNTVWRDSGTKLLVSCRRPGFPSGVGTCIVWIGTDAYEAELTKRLATTDSSNAAAK